MSNQVHLVDLHRGSWYEHAFLVQEALREMDIDGGLASPKSLIKALDENEEIRKKIRNKGSIYTSYFLHEEKTDKGDIETFLYPKPQIRHDGEWIVEGEPVKLYIPGNLMDTLTHDGFLDHPKTFNMYDMGRKFIHDTRNSAVRISLMSGGDFYGPLHIQAYYPNHSSSSNIIAVESHKGELEESFDEFEEILESKRKGIKL